MIFLKTTFQISLLVLLICCSFLSNAWAQQKKNIEDSGDSCEIASLKLEGVADKLNKISKKESYLIIIGGSSKKAKAYYNNNRISDAIKFLVEFTKIKNEKIVFGVGASSKSNELGYLKFYINGELVEEIKWLGKGRLCFGMGETFSD